MLINLLRNFFLNYLSADNKNKKLFVIHLFALIGASITGITSIIAFSNNNIKLSFILAITSFIFTSSLISQKYFNNFRLSSYFILYQLYILMFYLLHSGGANNTGPLWIFMTAPVTFFICGLKHGLVNLALFIIITSIILFIPIFEFPIPSYPVDFKIRLLSSFITVSALSALYEYARESSYNAMLEMSNKFEKLSKIDPLTQLSNRRDATEVIEYEKRRLLRNNTELSLIICDIDNFKHINDKYGHDVGDSILVEIAKVFKSCVRSQDTIARWGGEEFLFIFPYTNALQAGVTAKKIHNAIKEKSPLSTVDNFDITVSMGISTLTNDRKIELAISDADKNLYKAKNSGKNKTFSDHEEINPD